MTNTNYPAPDGPLPAYLAVPTTAGPWPGVVVVQDILGMTTELKRVTDRLAEQGYLALAPALYRRGPRITCLINTIRQYFRGSGPLYNDLVAARDFLASDERCSGKVGLAGFCMGGGFALLLSPSGHFDAVAANYGLVPRDLDSLRDSCPVVASFGAKDRVVRAGSAATLEAALAKGSIPRDVKEYPDAGHAFMNDYRFAAPVNALVKLADMAYSEPEANDAWARIMSFFEEHLAGVD